MGGVATASRLLPAQSRGGGVGGLTGLLRTLWQLKSQTQGPSSESSSQTPPCCRQSSCSHSPSSPEPEPPEPHSAAGRSWVTRAACWRPTCGSPGRSVPAPTLLTGPRPGLLDLGLLLTGGLSEMTCTVVGDTVAAAHGTRWGLLTLGAHTSPRQAHRPESTHLVSAGLCTGGTGQGSARRRGTPDPSLPAPTAPLTAVSC